MFQRALALLALVLTPSLFAANVITSESPVAALHWQPGNTPLTVAIAHGTTRSFEAVQDGALVFGEFVAADGRPDVGTRRYLGDGTLTGAAAIGDDFFVALQSADGNTLRLLRVSDGKQAQFTLPRSSLTSDGNHLLLVYHVGLMSAGQLLDRDLKPVVPQFTIAPTTAFATDSRVVGLAGQFFAVTDINATFIGPPNYQTVLIDDGGRVQLVNPPIPSQSFGSGGSEVLFFFTGSPQVTAWMQRFTPTLTAITDLAPITKSDTHIVSAPAAVPFGGGFFTSWIEDGTDVYVRRLGASDTLHVAGGPKPTTGAVELGPGTVLARWKDPYGNRLVRRVDTPDDAHADVLLPAEERSPSIASDGTTSIVAWGENDVRIARVAPDGSSPDGEGIVISHSPAHPVAGPQILFDGSRYIVFWTEQTSIFARYLERDGTPSGDIFRVSPESSPAGSFSVAWTGSQFLLSWTTFDPAVLAVMAPGGVAAVPVGSYEHLAGLGGPRPMAFGERVPGHLSATFFDTKDVVDLLVVEQNSSRAFHVASNGHGYLVTWTERHVLANSQVEYTVWAARLDANGRFNAPPMPITKLAVGYPYVGPAEGVPLFDGTNYRIVYAGATLGEAILTDQSFACQCFDRTDIPFDTASMLGFAATLGAGGSVIVYSRPFLLPDGHDVHGRNFVRFARPAPPQRRRVAGRT